MVERPKEAKIFERILVPLDVSSEAGVGLLFAARLARALESRLEGLFIEDQDLMSLAGLPFARELSLTSGLPQALDLDRLERAFKAKAAAAERLLRQVAEAENVESSFRTARGKTEAEITAAARADDLVAVSRATGAVVGRGAQGAAVGVASRRVVGSILLTGHRTSTAPRTVEAVFAGTTACEPALRLAERLAVALKARLGIHLPAPTMAQRQALEDRARRTLIHPAAARFQAADDVPHLLADLCRRPEGLVVAARTVLDQDEESIERLAARLACPLLLVRSQTDDRGPSTEQKAGP